MKRSCLLLVPICLIASLVLALSPQVSLGRAQYKKNFLKKYIKEAPSTEPEKALSASAKKANCNVCHAGKEKKDPKNAYGEAMAKALGAKNVKAADKIDKALEDVDKMPSASGDAKSPTFGDLMREGKLPAAPAPAH